MRIGCILTELRKKECVRALFEYFTLDNLFWRYEQDQWRGKDKWTTQILT